MLIIALLAAAQAEDIEEQNARLVRRKPRATSMLLYDMMADADAAQELQLRYWMAQSFQRIGLYHTAQRYYRAVVEAGESRWRDEALIALVALSAVIGDDADLVAMAAALRPERFPAPVASTLHYLQGVHHHNQGALAEAAVSYQAVSYGTPRYFSARLRLSVVQATSGEPTAARDVLVDLIRTAPVGTRLQKTDAEAVQALAQLDLARLYYAAGRYEDAVVLYAQVADDTPWRSVADLESGWAALMLGDTAAAMRRGLQASTAAYLPEGEVLAASAALQSGGCPAALPILTDVLDAHRPVLDELARTPSMSGAELWDGWFGDATTSAPALPASFFSRLLRDQSLVGTIYRMDRIAQEQALAASQSPDWVDSVGEGIIAMLASDHATVTARVHTQLAERTALLRNALVERVDEAETMRSACLSGGAPPAAPASRPEPDTDAAPQPPTLPAAPQ
ncbi:MAG: tetratricopeptide repeat protein [Myxococcota bacterium]|nr:tetratricopeptide repeat protein [Myxococcota bacterium]